MRCFGVVLGVVLSCGAMEAADCVIGPGQVGPFRIGMAMKQARRAWPGAVLKDTEDVEQLAIVQVLRDGKPIMDLYPDQDGLRDLELIRVYTPECSTADGIRPGLPLAEVEKRYSKMIRIERTEVQNREYAGFPKAPKWMDIEVGNGEAGVYAKGKRCATMYKPNATIRALSITRASVNKPTRFFESDAMCDVK